MSLAGWDTSKSYGLLIDHTKVSTDLTDFPVLLNITSSGSGITAYNCSELFDELDYTFGSSGTINDTFTGPTGSAPNTTIWSDTKHTTAGTTLGTCEIANNQLVFDIVNTTTTVYIQSVYKLSGDFDVQVPWTIESGPTTDSDWGFGLLVSEVADDLFAGTYGLIARYTTVAGPYRANTAGQTAVTGGTADTSGKFRLVRQASTLLMQYWSGSDWATLKSESSYTTTDLYVKLFSRTWSDNSIEVSFDDFTVVSGSLAWPQNTFPNRHNIAVEHAAQQCYCEVEYWDQLNKSAQIWTKVPTVASGADTQLFLYYDATVSGNTGYVGDIGSSAAQNVWSNNFTGVWHLSQDPSLGGACILDSTSYANHATPSGSMTAGDVVSTVFGPAMNLDGVDDYFGITHSSELSSSSQTVECFFKAPSAPQADNAGLVSKSFTTDFEREFDLTLSNTTGYAQSLITDGVSTTANINTEPTSIADGAWHNCALVKKAAPAGDYLSVFADNTLDTVQTTFTGYQGTNEVVIGKLTSSSPTERFFDDIMRGVRISSVSRSEPWLTATTFAATDNLVSYTGIRVYFSSAYPANIVDYGFYTDLSIVATISGVEGGSTYDLGFYDITDNLIGTTVSGILNGQAASSVMSTPSGIDYSWYAIATVSGQDYTSNNYTFTNRFKAAGTVNSQGAPVSGTLIRLYKRSDGSLVGETTTSASGTFIIATPHTEEHFCIAFPTESTYNAVIYDRVKP